MKKFLITLFILILTLIISGCGNVMAGDLAFKSAQVTVSGLGAATV